MSPRKTSDNEPEGSGKSFTDYLAGCPSVDEPGQTASITAVGVVMRTGTEGRFALRTQDEVVHEIPVEAVESFSALGSSPATQVAQLQLNPTLLDADLAGRLRAGIAKQPFETVKELPTDTGVHDKNLFETVKEPPQDKQPFKDVATDPLIDKAVPKDPPGDTHKELPKDPIHDKPVFKDIHTDPIFDKHPIKEIAKDPILDNVAKDPASDQIPLPGGPVIQPQLQAMAAQDMTARAFGGQPQLKGGSFDTAKEIIKENIETIKEGPFDTAKEIAKDHLETIKEIGKDPILDTRKEVIGDQTLAETIPGLPGGTGQPQFQAMAAQPDMAARALAGQPQLKPLQNDTAKEMTFETIKELGKDPIQDTLKESQFDTLKEVGGGDTWKELVAETIKELSKDPIFDGGGNTGIADTLVEQIPGGGGFTLAEGGPMIPGGMGPVVQPAGGLSPFVLATPHQAPQGALAQQYVAAMAARGTLF